MHNIVLIIPYLELQITILATIQHKYRLVKHLIVLDLGKGCSRVLVGEQAKLQFQENFIIKKVIIIVGAYLTIHLYTSLIMIIGMCTIFFVILILTVQNFQKTMALGGEQPLEPFPGVGPGFRLISIAAITKKINQFW